MKVVPNELLLKNNFSKVKDAIYFEDNRNAKMTILNNDINWENGNWSTITTPQSVTGITVNNAVTNNVGFLNITKNNIANLQKGITLTLQGYNGTGNTNRVQVIDNKIRFNQFQTSIPSTLHFGIGIFASQRVTVDGNDVNGDILRTTAAPATYNTQPQVELFNGIRLENSPEAWITNVKIDKVPGSLYVLGSCPNSNFWCNKFNNSFNGVRLNAANIGNQLNLAAPYTNSATNNTWGSPLNTTLLINGTISSPLTWYYSGGGTSNPSSSAGTVPGLVFATPTNTTSPCGYLLLVQQTNPNTPTARVSMLGDIVNNTSNITQNVSENKLWADKYAYRKLRKNNDLRVLGTTDDYQYQNYVLNNNNTCTGKLDQLTDYLDSLPNNVCSQFNSTITTNITANIARKQVNDIYIRSWHKGEPAFTSNDSIYLCDLAASDALIYGDAVYSAKVMINECGGFQNNNNRIIGISQEVEETITTVGNKIEIIPNPNNGLMKVSVKLKEGDNSVLEIFDVSGRKLSSYQLQAGTDNFEIDESTLNAGTYIYRFFINGALIKADKIIIMK